MWGGADKTGRGRRELETSEEAPGVILGVVREEGQSQFTPSHSLNFVAALDWILPTSSGYRTSAIARGTGARPWICSTWRQRAHGPGRRAGPKVVHAIVCTQPSL